jgi:hypothetical protein
VGGKFWRLEGGKEKMNWNRIEFEN